jgi:L-amino acid N-acyltransferase YncA
MPNKPSDSDITVAVQPFDQIIDDLKPLLAGHWRELALHQDSIPLDPNFEGYRKANELGLSCMFAVRKSGDLIGYAVYFIAPHMHYRTHKWAVSDLFWLHPDHRRAGVGNALFDCIERELLALDVDVMHTTIKEHFPAAGSLLESRGHAMIERGYSKKLR